jgi:hypothetical protein
MTAQPMPASATAAATTIPLVGDTYTRDGVTITVVNITDHDVYLDYVDAEGHHSGYSVPIGAYPSCHIGTTSAGAKFTRPGQTTR